MNFKEFRKHILLEQELNSPLMEGIDIDAYNKTVSFTTKHEKNVDTSTDTNPTYYKVGEYDVISIFKRIDSENHNFDGNPLIKALKGIDGWKFKNCKKDIKGLLEQFLNIVKKIDSKYDTIILTPSNNELNKRILHKLCEIIKFDNKIEDLFIKLSCEEVLDNGLDRDLIKKSDDIEYTMGEINRYIDIMIKKNSGYFSYKNVDPKDRKYFKHTMKLNSDIIKYSEFINDKMVLILDDTISTGGTISEVCENILKTYTPKDLKIITLFSKK